MSVKDSLTNFSKAFNQVQQDEKNGSPKLDTDKQALAKAAKALTNQAGNDPQVSRFVNALAQDTMTLLGSTPGYGSNFQNDLSALTDPSSQAPAAGASFTGNTSTPSSASTATTSTSTSTSTSSTDTSQNAASQFQAAASTVAGAATATDVTGDQFAQAAMWLMSQTPAAQQQYLSGMQDSALSQQMSAFLQANSDIPVYSSGSLNQNLYAAAATYCDKAQSLESEDTSSQPSSSYTQPSSSYTQPSSSYTQPSSSYTQPSSSYTQPSSSYTQPSSSYTQPSSSYTQPSSSYTPTTSTQTSTSATTNPASAALQSDATTVADSTSRNVTATQYQNAAMYALTLDGADQNNYINSIQDASLRITLGEFVGANQNTSPYVNNQLDPGLYALAGTYFNASQMGTDPSAPQTQPSSSQTTSSSTTAPTSSTTGTSTTAAASSTTGTSTTAAASSTTGTSTTAAASSTTGTSTTAAASSTAGTTTTTAASGSAGSTTTAAPANTPSSTTAPAANIGNTTSSVGKPAAFTSSTEQKATQTSEDPPTYDLGNGFKVAYDQTSGTATLTGPSGYSQTFTAPADDKSATNVVLPDGIQLHLYHDDNTNTPHLSIMNGDKANTITIGKEIYNSDAGQQDWFNGATPFANNVTNVNVVPPGVLSSYASSATQVAAATDPTTLNATQFASAAMYEMSLTDDQRTAYLATIQNPTIKTQMTQFFNDKKGSNPIVGGAMDPNLFAAAQTYFQPAQMQGTALSNDDIDSLIGGNIGNYTGTASVSTQQQAFEVADQKGDWGNWPIGKFVNDMKATSGQAYEAKNVVDYLNDASKDGGSKDDLKRLIAGYEQSVSKNSNPIPGTAAMDAIYAAEQSLTANPGNKDAIIQNLAGQLGLAYKPGADWKVNYTGTGKTTPPTSPASATPPDTATNVDNSLSDQMTQVTGFMNKDHDLGDQLWQAGRAQGDYQNWPIAQMATAFKVDPQQGAQSAYTISTFMNDTSQNATYQGNLKLAMANVLKNGTDQQKQAFFANLAAGISAIESGKADPASVVKNLMYQAGIGLKADGTPAFTADGLKVP